MEQEEFFIEEEFQIQMTNELYLDQGLYLSPETDNKEERITKGEMKKSLSSSSNLITKKEVRGDNGNDVSREKDVNNKAYEKRSELRRSG